MSEQFDAWDRPINEAPHDYWREAYRKLEDKNKNLRKLLKEGMARVHWHDCPGCKDFVEQARAALRGKA